MPPPLGAAVQHGRNFGRPAFILYYPHTLQRKENDTMPHHDRAARTYTRAALTLITLILLLAFSAPAHALKPGALVPRADLWVANGRVYTVAASATTLYLGGEFTQLGPAIGSFVGLSATTGSRDASVPTIVVAD